MNFELSKKRAVTELVANGVKRDDAEILADCLVTADLYGVTSHGTVTLPAHIARIKRGAYNLAPDFKVLKSTPSFAVINGDNAIGAVSAEYCLRYGMERAREVGVYTVLSRNNNTLGAAFYYSLLAAREGMIAFVCTNSPAQMAPVGGREKMLGTNPFAAVIPVPDGEPIIIDMATSVVAKSKFNEYKKAGKPLPEGWALDKEGNPTTDPDAALAGLVLPMAGFKGYAISMLIDIFAGVMSGAAYLDGVGRFYGDGTDSMNVGFYMSVIDPKVVFGEEFFKQIQNYKDRLRASDKKENSTVFLPGDDRLKKFKESNQ